MNCETPLHLWTSAVVLHTCCNNARQPGHNLIDLNSIMLVNTICYTSNACGIIKQLIYDVDTMREFGGIKIKLNNIRHYRFNDFAINNKHSIMCAKGTTGWIKIILMTVESYFSTAGEYVWRHRSRGIRHHIEWRQHVDDTDRLIAVL